jgi:hypothetical protein
MSSLSKIKEYEVQSFIVLMFPSFQMFRGSTDESEAILELEQGLRHAKEANNSQDCCTQTSVQDQFTKATSIGICARIGISNVDRLYQENFNKYVYHC